MAVWIAGSSPAMTIRLRIKIERRGRRFCGRKIPRKKRCKIKCIVSYITTIIDTSGDKE
jgi:hypothetical protein